MLGFKSFTVKLAEGIADANSLMSHDSKLRSAGYKRVGSFSHPTNGNQVHSYQTGKGKKAQTIHLHTKQGVVHKSENQAGAADLLHAKKSLGEEVIEEGWFFGDRYKRIGNKNATHRITFHHVPTNSKHTVDVTAPTDRHAESHVHRHVLGGRNGTAPIKIKRIQHLHESEGDGTHKDHFPATHEHKGLTYYRTGKIGLHVNSGQRTAEYEHETDHAKYRVWRGHKTGETLREDLQEARTIGGGSYDIEREDAHAHKVDAEVKKLQSHGHKIGMVYHIDADSSGGTHNEARITYKHAKHGVDYNKWVRSRMKAGPANHSGHVEKDGPVNESIVKRVHDAIQHGAAKTHLAGLSGPENLSTGPGGMAVPAAYGAAHAVDHLTGGRISGAIKKIGSKLRREDLDEALEIKHAINHLDRQARHHARKYKEHQGGMNSITNNPEHSHEQALKYQKHAEDAIWHHGQYKARLKQLDAGKNEDLQELSKKTLGSYIGKAAVSIKQNTRRAYKHQSAALDTRDTRNDHDAFGDEQRDVNLKTKWAKPFVKKINNRATGIRRAAAKLAKEDLDLQEISKGLAARYLEKAKPAYDAKRQELNKPDHTGPVWGDMKGRIKKFSDKVDKLGRRREGINRAQARLTKEENETQKPHPKGTRVVVSHKGHQKPGRVIRHDPGGPDSSPFYIVDVGEYGSGKFMAHHVRKEDLVAEGIISRTLNAIKNANKKLTPAGDRIAKTREKVGYDNAKSPDLRPRGKALRKVEKIEWSKANPTKKPKDIVPMGKLPDKLWSSDSDKPKPKRVTDDSLDRPMFRKAGALSRRFKTEDLEESGTLRIITQKSSKDAKKKAAAAEKRAERKKVRDQQNKPDARSDYQKKLDALTARIKNRPFGQTSEELEPKGGSKFLKEKPKRGPDGKLIKSKAAQRVEDCIKMSGKKEQIDTEPTLNNLTTPGLAGQ